MAKILQINANYGFGSTGLIIKDIDALISQQSDLESIVAYQRINAHLDNGIVIGSNIDWKLHALLSRIFGKQGLYSSLPTRKFIGLLKHIKPDIVHLHNLHSNYININILLKYLAKNDIPTVVTMHDCWWFTGKCFHYIDVGCNRFTTGCGKCPKLKAPPASLFFDCTKSVYSIKKSALLAIPRLTVVGCSDWICGEAQKSFLREKNIVKLYNGVDTSIFKPAEEPHNECFTVMGMANKWLTDRERGLIDAILDGTDCQIMIVGCTDTQQKELSNYGPRVKSIGFIKNREDLAMLYNQADVFINVTHADTLPTVNMEAICCGTPVITYNSTGSPELVNQNTGYVVDEGDWQGIIELINKRKFPDRMFCAWEGKRIFDKNTCYDRYIDLYRLILIKC